MSIAIIYKKSDLLKTRLKTSFRPKPRVHVPAFKFYKVNYRQKARFETANSRLYEIKKNKTMRLPCGGGSHEEDV